MQIYLTIERTAKYSLSYLFTIRVYRSYQFLKIGSLLAIFNSFTRRFDSQVFEQLPLIFCYYFFNLENGMYSALEINIR